MKGSHTVFGVTNYWEKGDMQLEIQQGKNLADAAKVRMLWSLSGTVSHSFVANMTFRNPGFSITSGAVCIAPPSVRDIPVGTPILVLMIYIVSEGKLAHVYHFDGKAEVAEYVETLGIPASYFMPGFYMSNLPGQMFKLSPDNTYTLGLPIASTAPIPMYDTRDTGIYVKAIVLNKDKLLGKRLLGATSYMTGKEIVDSFKKAFPEAGRTARYVEVPETVYRNDMKSKGVPDYMAEEMYENFRLMQDFGYYGGEALDATHQLTDGLLTTWEEHAKSARVWAHLK